MKKIGFDVLNNYWTRMFEQAFHTWSANGQLCPHGALWSCALSSGNQLSGLPGVLVHLSPPGVHVNPGGVTIKVEVTLVEALLRHLPELAVVDLAESVGISPHVVCPGGPEHLSRLAPGPGGDSRISKQTILVMLQSRLTPDIATTAHASISSPTAPAKGGIFSITSVRVSSVQATSIAIDGGGSRRGPGVVSSLIVPLEASVNKLFVNGDLRHSGEVGEPGIAASTAGAAVSCLVLEAPVLLQLRLGHRQTKLTLNKLLLVGATVRGGPPGAWRVHAAMSPGSSEAEKDSSSTPHCCDKVMLSPH